jgi:aminoglycoside phosphotransferase
MTARVDWLLPAIAAELGLDVVGTLGGGEFGAALVRDDAGRERVLKAMPGTEWAPRFARGVDVCGFVRSPGYPVPRYFGTGVAAGASWSLQEHLPGSVPDVMTAAHATRLVELVRRHAGAAPADGDLPRRFAIEIGDAAARLAERRDTAELGAVLAAILATAASAPVRTRDVVHGDFHHRNYLAIDDRVTAVFDWELAWIGDWRVDLVNLACWASWVPTQVRFDAAGVIVDAALDACEPAILALFTAFHTMRALDFNVRAQPERVAGLVAIMNATTRSWL